MILIIQCIIGCIAFTMVLIPAAINPAKYLSMYPLAVQKKVLELPQYQQLVTTSNKKLKMLVIQSVAFIIVGIIICIIAEANTFLKAFVHMYLFFLTINIYDLLVIDWLIFCRSKKIRIPGTEEMDKEYKDYLFHFKVFLRGLILGLFIALIVAAFVSVI